MIHVESVVVTSRAATALRHERQRVETRAEEVFALIYMASVTNADGTAASGFEPGYVACSWHVTQPSSNWVVARLPDGSAFHFMPRFKLSPSDGIVVDRAGGTYATFSIARG